MRHTFTTITPPGCRSLSLVLESMALDKGLDTLCFFLPDLAPGLSSLDLRVPWLGCLPLSVGCFSSPAPGSESIGGTDTCLGAGGGTGETTSVGAGADPGFPVAINVTLPLCIQRVLTHHIQWS